MVKIIEMLIPKSNKKTRPGTKRVPRSITIHETANLNVRANALAHARLQFLGNPRQASWQYTTDDEPEVYRSIPDDEVAYAGGDGAGPGNSYSIHIEMSVNIDGDYLKTVGNTVQLVRYLINKHPTITHVDVVQHHKWSKKDCPRYLRSGVKGIDWNGFLKQVREGKVAATAPVAPPKYATTNNDFKIGQQVRVKKSAKTYATGQVIPAFVKGKTDTIQQRGSNRMLLKGIYSWVKTSDLESVTASTPKSTPKSAPKPKGKTLHLPKSASAWRVYPTNKVPVKANALSTRLNPKKFGGLTYAIIGNPQKDVYTIKTAQLGTVNIYAAPSTGATIK